MNQVPDRKRTLKKVNRQFLNRRYQENDEIEQQVENIPQCLTLTKSNEIVPFFGISEKGRKIYFNESTAGKYYNVTNIGLEAMDHKNTAKVTFQRNDNQESFSWEYIAARLESYGDSDLLPWAQRIRNYHSNYSQVMEKYFNLINLDELQVFKALRKSKTRAIKACKELEEKYSFIKTIYFCDKVSSQFLSISYDEGYLKEMGFTVEEFLSHTKGGGSGTPFESDTQMHLEIAKDFLDKVIFNRDPIQVGPEFPLPIVRKDGTKQDCISQSVVITEPTSEGVFIYNYYILKENTSNKKQESGMIHFMEEEMKPIMEELEEHLSYNQNNNNNCPPVNEDSKMLIEE